MVGNIALTRYYTALAGFCKQCAALQSTKERIEDGEVVTADEVKDLCGTLSVLKENLLSVKDEIGFSDGLKFLGDNNFAGFRIKDGVVIGSYDNLMKVASPWYDQFKEGDGNNYRFEVANYLFAFQSLVIDRESGMTGGVKPVFRKKGSAVIGHKPKLKKPKLLRKMFG